MTEHDHYDIWRDVRRKVLDTLHVAVPGMDFERKVMIAEDAAREVAREIDEFRADQHVREPVMDDDYKPRCRRGHFMKGRVFTGEGGNDEVEWCCDYCRRLSTASTIQGSPEGSAT